jgi:beta-glucanase (GH16 family)
MKHYLLKTLIPCIFSIINLGSPLIAQANVDDTSKYRFSPTISWGDEFNYSGSPDTKKWGLDEGNGFYGWGNNEQQYYRPENAVVSGSTLRIIAKAESYKGFNYTSAKLNTREKRMFQYGRFEIRAKLPVTAGMWPAIFLFGEDHQWFNLNSWPNCGEIDMLELSSNDNARIHQSIHCGHYNYKNGNLKFQKTHAKTDKFNTYRLDWTPEYIRWFINGVQSFEVKNDGGGHSHWPFDDWYNLILSLSVGGAFTGTPNAAALPQTYEVDYVRYYKLLGDYQKPIKKKIAAPTLNTTGGTKYKSDYFYISVVTKPENSTVKWYAGGVEVYTGDFFAFPPKTPPGTYVGAAVAVNNTTGIASEPVTITVKVVTDQ